MATLLELVNQLIGNTLYGNIYTNVDPFVKLVMQRPDNADAHVPNTDPRLLNIEKGTEHPHTDSPVIPPPAHGRPPMIRGDIYQPEGTVPPNISSQQQTPPRPIQDNPELNDLLSFHNDVVEDTSFTKGQQFDSANRQEIYKSPDSSIGGTDISKPTLGDMQSAAGQPPAAALNVDPPVLADIAPLTPSQIANFAKGKSFDDVARADMYKSPDSNVGGTEISNQTQGDENAIKGKPPAPNLLFKGPDDAPTRKEYAGAEGKISDNAFDDGFGIGGKFASMTQRPVPPEFRFVDVFAIAHWIRNVGSNLLGVGEESAQPSGLVSENIEKTIRGLTFVAEQFLLASLNPGGIGVSALNLGAEDSNYDVTNAVYNPLAIPASMIARVYGTAIGDVAPIVVGPFFGGDYRTSLLTKLMIDEDILTKKGQTSIPTDLPGGTPSVLDEILKAVPGGQYGGAIGGLGDKPVGPLDAGFPEEEEGLRSKLIEEDAIYLPFMFQDLRDDPPKFLYFRAFLKPGLSETFTPDWQTNRYYGRVDQVPIYQGTLRTLNVAFDVVAWSPDDFTVIWKKLEKLQSMAYPTYTTKGFFKAGPIVRMRVGDLIAGKDNKGLPGYITAMDWSFDDGIWNIQTDEKAPRKISVSLSYTVLHDGNPGIYPYLSEEIDITAPETEPTTKETYFGAAKFISKGDKVQVDVSPAEIRKIFDTVKNK